MVKRIAITGPESTGKSFLAEQLSNYFNEPWVPEYSREYLKNIALNYQFDDIEKIAREQLKRENLFLGKANSLIFCDTDFTVAKIWSEEVFGSCSGWVNDMFYKNIYDLYLLCVPDIPWHPDPLRQNPNDRERLFAKYLSALKHINANYYVIEGLGDERLKKAVSFVKQFLSSEK